MHTEISKKWSFDAAHQLPNHNGKCANLHGHTYTLEIVVSLQDGSLVEGPGRSDEGMVMDFYDITKVWKEQLEPLLDHKFLNDTLKFRTTSENISRWALGVFRGAGIPAIECSVSETASSWARSYFTGADLNSEGHTVYDN